jgi:hypothetical protein
MNSVDYNRHPVARSAFPLLRTVLVVFTSVWPKAMAADRPPGELAVKAAFVLNFMRMVNWSAVPGIERSVDLGVCAVGNSGFAEAVRKAIEGKSVGGRSISFKLASTPDETQCRVLVLDEAQYPGVKSLIDRIKTSPVLTVGNGPGLVRLGGMFDLALEDRNVVFDANADAIRLAGLDVSARLLQLCRNLRRGRTSGN